MLFYELFFSISYLAAPRATLGYWGESLIALILATALILIQCEGHGDPRNEVESQSSPSALVWSEQEAYRFWV